MAYTPIGWLNDQAPAINQTNLNKMDTEIKYLSDSVGQFMFTQNKASRIMTIHMSAQAGDLIYFKPIAWGGAAFTQITLSGILNGTSTVIARVYSLGSEARVSIASNYDSFQVGVSASSAPSTNVVMTAIVANESIENIAKYAIESYGNVAKSMNVNGYLQNITTFASVNTNGIWLTLNSQVSSVTDKPEGYSGDYLFKVSKYGNGYSQELLSLGDASEHHIRYILNSTGTGEWKSFKAGTAVPFASRGYITNTTLTDKSNIGTYLLLSSYAQNITDGPGNLDTDYILNVYPFGNGFAQELIALYRPGERHTRYVLNSTGTGKWYSEYKQNINIATFGDSITRGQVGGTSPTQYTDSGFVRAGKLKGYQVTNYGIGGIGYSYTINNHNALNEINNANLSNTDIVTLSFGVNDWQNNIPIGNVDDSTINTLCGGLNLAIQKVMEKNPKVTLIVFSPLNCSFKGGNAETKWALGLELATSGTLEDTFNAIKSVCEKYEIAFVDMTHGNPVVNVLNCNNTNVLGDRLHPTIDTYKKLGEVIKNFI